MVRTYAWHEWVQDNVQLTEMSLCNAALLICPSLLLQNLYWPLILIAIFAAVQYFTAIYWISSFYTVTTYWPMYHFDTNQSYRVNLFVKTIVETISEIFAIDFVFQTISMNDLSTTLLKHETNWTQTKDKIIERRHPCKKICISKSQTILFRKFRAEW